MDRCRDLFKDYVQKKALGERAILGGSWSPPRTHTGRPWHPPTQGTAGRHRAKGEGCHLASAPHPPDNVFWLRFSRRKGPSDSIFHQFPLEFGAERGPQSSLRVISLDSTGPVTALWGKTASGCHQLMAPRREPVVHRLCFKGGRLQDHPSLDGQSPVMWHDAGDTWPDC